MAAKRYHIKHKASEYTFPTDEPQIRSVDFDNHYLHVELVDGRKVLIPLHWIPTLYHATPAERETYEILGGMLYYDPETSPINDTIIIRDYLVGTPAAKSEAEDDHSQGAADGVTDKAAHLVYDTVVSPK